MSLTSFSSGVNTSFSTELNNNFNASKVLVYLSASSLDTSQSGSGTTSNTYTSTINSSSLVNQDYLDIELCGEFYALAYGGTDDKGRARISVLVENLTDSTTIWSGNAVDADMISSDEQSNSDKSNIFKGVYELSNDNKTNGMELKFTVSCINTGSGTPTTLSRFTNRSLVVKGLY